MPAIVELLRWPFQPLIESLRGYSARKFRSDLLAAMTVSVVEIPQAMAYALIAGVPPQYGIYTSIVQGTLGAVFSSSQHLTTGPTNTQSLLVAAAVTRLASPGPDPSLYLSLVFTLSILKGLVQLVFFALRLSELVPFISRAVIFGISSGAGILIISGQLPGFLGVSRSPDSPFFGIVGDVHRMLPHLHEVEWSAVLIGLLTVVLTVGSRWVNRFLPGALLAVVVSATLVALTGMPVAVVGRLDASLPSLRPPPFDWASVSGLFSGALALAVLGSIETIAIAKSLGKRTGERIAPDREIFGQGVSNLLGGLLQCMPATASFTRSALDYDAGGQTRFAAVLNAALVGTIFFALQEYARFIPYASLAGVLFVVAWGLVEARYFLRLLRADRSDATVFAATFLATVLIPLQYAVFVGVFLNVLFHLRTSSRLHIAEMVQTEGGGFLERPIFTRGGERSVVFVQLEGDLFFAVADQLQEQLNALRRAGVRIVILRLKRTHSMDATILDVLEEFAGQMRRAGGHLLLCGVRPTVMSTLRRFDLVQVIGADNIFPAGEKVFTSAKRAVQRARELLNQSIDTSHLRPTDLSEELDFQI